MKLALSRAKAWSLRVRLIVFFVLLLISVWMLAALFSWRENRIHIDEFFDTQQMLYAKQLAATDFSMITQHLPATKQLFDDGEAPRLGRQEEAALGFAVFCRRGRLLLSDGEKGKSFVFDNQTRGFVNTQLKDSQSLWRIVWVPSFDGKRVVAVGQQLSYRTHVALRMMQKQFVPWILILPVLLAGFLLMINRELSPLRSMAATLATRRPQDTSPLPTDSVPSEVRPLVKSLNSLFARIAAMLTRERAFISDAAHELRTPLTALHIQAEVAALAEHDPAARAHALDQLLCGIDRSNRLVEQLLTLSRLEAMLDKETDEVLPESFTTLNWPELLEDALAEYRAKAEAKGIILSDAMQSAPEHCTGDPALTAILLRNLLDNAVRYTPVKGHVHVSLNRHRLSIENSGSGVDDAYIGRLSERFFRPPGQIAPGSGLGLSIVQRIASLQGLRLILRNKTGIGGSGHTGFIVRIMFGPLKPERSFTPISNRVGPKNHRAKCGKRQAKSFKAAISSIT